MLNIAIIRFVFYLSLPWLISRGIGALFRLLKKGNAVKDKDAAAALHNGAGAKAGSKKAFWSTHRAIYALVLLVILHYLHCVFLGGLPLNFFQVSQTPVILDHADSEGVVDDEDVDDEDEEEDASLSAFS